MGIQGVPPSGSGYSPKGGAAKASPAKPSIPNAIRTVTWRPRKDLKCWVTQLPGRRSVTVSLGRTRGRKRVWAVIFKGRRGKRELAIPDDAMLALIDHVRRIEKEEKLAAIGWEPHENPTAGLVWKASEICAAQGTLTQSAKTAKLGLVRRIVARFAPANAPKGGGRD